MLAGADAVVFVADSQRSAASANAYSWRDMEANLKSNGIDFDQIPKVVQFNKRDLPDVKPLGEIKQAWGDVPTFPAAAIRGEGVLETFRELLRRLYRSIDERHDFGGKVRGVGGGLPEGRLRQLPERSACRGASRFAGLRSLARLAGAPLAKTPV